MVPEPEPQSPAAPADHAPVRPPCRTQPAPPQAREALAAQLPAVPLHASMAVGLRDLELAHLSVAMGPVLLAI